LKGVHIHALRAAGRRKFPWYSQPVIGERHHLVPPIFF